MTSKSYSKDDLKRLMEERKQEHLKKKRIDSPLAGYDKDGCLFCKVCEFKIENVNLWTKHLVSKEHKLILERIKKGQSIDQQEIKKRKFTIDEPGDTKSKQQRTESDSILNENTKEKQSTEDNSTGLTSNSTVVIKDLPKGFFDNPEEDAKVRDEIFKDPMDEEWSKFQRTIQVENKVIDNYNETDLVETQNYRELNEIDEQIEHWHKINELEIKRDAMKSIKRMEVEENRQVSSDESDEETDLENEFNILSNWRCKKT